MHSFTSNEQISGEFQQAKDEVLTYVLSEQIPTSPIQKHRQKNINKIQERHKLQLMNHHHNQIVKDFNFKQFNKNTRKIETALGKIIPIGSVTFKSNFQCGNISNVEIVAPNTYQIELQKQTNSNRRSSWFYFTVEGIKGQAHFIIQGFTKSTSLYNQGMKICYRDTKQVASKWRRGGTRISYCNSIDDQDQQKPTYQLRFSHFFKSNQHTCLEFAYCFPYGFKKLTNLLSHVRHVAQLQILGKTFNGIDIPLLTIGNKNSEKIIILSSRVHPGETVASYIMEGFLQELVGDNQFGRALRANYLFKVVPMLNPDGVVKGNYRFSGYGCDLNRKWKNCKENAQPQVYYMRELIRNLNKEKTVLMYIDMHGHSRKKNVFFYGCCEKGPVINTKPKQFPYLMEKIHDAFKYQNCCFSVQKDKEGTARITAWKQLKIDYVYTLQSSFCGPEYGQNYLETDYQKIGKKLCQGIAVFFFQDIQSTKPQQLFKNSQKISAMKKKVIQQFLQNPRLAEVGDIDDSGSESEPEVGEIQQKQRNVETGIPKSQAFINLNKNQIKTKKKRTSNKFFSQQSIRQNPFIKTKSQVLNCDEQAPKYPNYSQLKQKKSQNTIVIQNTEPKYDKIEIKISNNVNTVEIESLRASSLYQRNVRVHSITKNNYERHTERSKRIVNPFCQEVSSLQKQQKIKINLLHGREGAQYRRVRKLAEQNLKRQMIYIEENNKIVKQLQNNNLQMSNSSIPIAPRFYPMSQQKNRRGSLQAYIKKQPRLDQLKKLSINGDQLNVRCTGRHVYL